MAVVNRYRTATGAGTLAALVLVLAFGGPWYADWSRESVTADTAGGWFLRLLTWPAWRFDADDSVQNVVAADVKAVLVVVFAALFLSLLPGSQAARVRGTSSQFVAGWSSYVFAGALAALLTALIRAEPSWLGAFEATASGATYGLFVGWIVGLATLGGRGSAG